MLEREKFSHNHEQEEAEHIRRDIVLEMKEFASSQPHLSLKEVYEQVLTESVARLGSSHDPDELGMVMPDFLEVRNSLQRRRAKVRPTIPASLRDISLQAPWTLCEDGGPFLLFDDGSANRILGFGSEESIRVLCSASCIFMDGTFRIVPRIFKQLYTLHASFRGKIMPLVYILLPNKEKETYKRMFELISTFASTLGLLYNPPEFRLDFEIAMLKAIEECFPHSEVSGCNFHFVQALYRRVQKYGLQKFYREDPCVNK